MENKNVGWLVIGMSLLVIFIIFLFNSAMKSIIDEGCPLMHQDSGALVCPAYKTINQQTYLSLLIVGILVIIGLFLVFSKNKERIIIKKVEQKKHPKKIDVSSLTIDERAVLNFVMKNGTIFQAELIEKTGFGKAKMSRIIDRLEGQGLVERKRRGMTNVVVMKED